MGAAPLSNTGEIKFQIDVQSVLGLSVFLYDVNFRRLSLIGLIVFCENAKEAPMKCEMSQQPRKI